jgi:hypothetical protein
MPVYSSWPIGNTLENMGAAAGTFPPPPVFNTLDRLGAANQPSLAPYIGALGPRSVTGPGRGSPGGGLPIQAREAPNLSLTRERLQRALEDDPRLAATLARNRSAEIGPQATGSERAFYDALVLDRAAARGEPLDYTLTNRAYFPATTTGYRGAVANAPVDPALFAGVNPANYATGNASLDPRTGRWVGFGGGPQTATIRSGRGMELGGIESQDLPYARAVGYTGPSSTPIGPQGPLGIDMANLSGTGGWETTVSATPGGVGYVNPERVARGGTTSAADLQRPPEGPGFLQNFLRALGSSAWTPAPQVPAIPAPPQAAGFRPTPLGGRVRGL